MKSKPERLRARELRVDPRAAVERHAARVVDARAVERLAGGEHARADAHAGLDRLAILLPFETRLAAGLRTVVMPNDSQMRPSASP